MLLIRKQKEERERERESLISDMNINSILRVSVLFFLNYDTIRTDGFNIFHIIKYTQRKQPSSLKAYQ